MPEKNNYWKHLFAHFWTPKWQQLFVFFSVFLSLALLKIFIISDNEILALNRPHDDLWYITAASKLYWFSSYTQMAFIHLPVYPLFIYFTHFLHIPLRLVIEIVYLLASFYFCISLFKVGLNKFYSVLAYGLIIFHPLSFELFNHTLSEVLYAPLLLTSLANGNIVWLHRGKKLGFFFSLLTGFSFALLWFTREENILIAALFGCIASLLMLSLVCKKISQPYFGILFRQLCLIPGGVIAVSVLTIHTANFMTFKSFGASDLHSPHYKAAYTALQRIETHTHTRFVPISTEARELAYTVSPTFRKVQPILENHSNFAFFYTKLTSNIENEMGAGWFYWMFRDAVYQSGMTSAETADDFYVQMAKEINQAFADGKLTSRPVFLDFVDPDLLLYLPEIPHSFLTISTQLINTTRPPQESDEPLPTSTIGEVNYMTRRRPALIKLPRQGTIRGWVFSEKGEPQQIRLLTAEGAQMATTQTLIDRPDVSEGYKKMKSPLVVPTQTGFSLEFSGFDATAHPSIEFTFPNGSYRMPVQDATAHQILTPTLPESGQKIYLALDDITIPTVSIPLNPQKEFLQSKIWHWYGKIIYFLSILALACSVLIVKNWKRFQNYDLFGILGILCFAIFTRIMLFAILDVSSWSGNQPRYIFPIMPLVAASLAIIFNLTQQAWSVPQLKKTVVIKKKPIPRKK